MHLRWMADANWGQIGRHMVLASPEQARRKKSTEPASGTRFFDLRLLHDEETE